MSLQNYWPEMGDKKPEAQIEATMSCYGAAHWYLDTPLELKGRGVKYMGQHPSDGRNRYVVTARAFEKIKEQYSVSQVCYLD